ncbi:MAG: site-specific integrase [Verrucomicrobiia bacterium]
MIDRLFKPKDSRVYRWRFREKPEDGKILDISLGTSELRVAEKRRTENRSKIQLERAGLVPPEKAVESAQRNLALHLEDFISDVRRHGKSEKHLANLEFRLGRLIKECHWICAINVSADSFQSWLCAHPELSAKTSNDYLDAARCFFNWLIQKKRFSVNPLESVDKVKTAGMQTRERRAFALDEFARLLAVAGERKPVYMMAFYTGLRRSEIAGLRWADVHLDDARPYVLARASTTKNGKEEPLPLHSDLIVVLREIKGVSQPDELVFKRFPRIERFKRDMAKANIPYRDALGRYADFHALRKTFGTNLAKAGVPRRAAMSLMRHSDGKLTDKIYTDVNLLGIETGIELLPSLLAPASPIASLKMFAAGHNLTSGGTMGSGVEMKPSVVSIGESHNVTPLVTSGHNVVEWRERRGSNP